MADSLESMGCNHLGGRANICCCGSFLWIRQIGCDVAESPGADPYLEGINIPFQVEFWPISHNEFLDVRGELWTAICELNPCTLCLVKSSGKVLNSVCQYY